MKELFFYNKKYDVIVIGAGHAGCEAAFAAAKMGCATLILTIDLDKIAAMPCSPSIGGTAKGNLVKEIDAMGGIMAQISDKSAIQYKTLNTRKGIAVQSTRTQNDKKIYHQEMKLFLENQKNIDIKQALVEDIIVENGKVVGLTDNVGCSYLTNSIVLAAGTFLGGLVHIGRTTISAGRAGEIASNNIPKVLEKLGFQVGRLKTGTPPRLDKRTIDFSCFKIHLADDLPKPFSYGKIASNLPQIPSYIGYTNEKNKEIVLKNLDKSPLYNGTIKGTSARYCPSFEDKAVKFSHREFQRVVLEPEGVSTNEIYASGLGNSLPPEIQIQFVRAVKGLENAEIMRFAYAIEYCYLNPVQLKPTLETKLVEGLFLAGQVNGTSGYEEAAAQGLVAGINASCKVLKREPFISKRFQSYMGVMIDDLVTKGTNEPYRIFTSRAEYRLLLRENNAELRLSKDALDFGLISKERFLEIEESQKEINEEKTRIKKTFIKPKDEINQYLKEKNSQILTSGTSLDQLLKRAELNYDFVDKFEPSQKKLSNFTKDQVEIETKYEGYIQRQIAEVEKFKNLEKIKIPSDFNFSEVYGLTREVKEKLNTIKPISLGQASRIPGITPVAISTLMIFLKKRQNH